jgi:hypothetical protein
MEKNKKPRLPVRRTGRKTFLEEILSDHDFVRPRGRFAGDGMGPTEIDALVRRATLHAIPGGRLLEMLDGGDEAHERGVRM